MNNFWDIKFIDILFPILGVIGLIFTYYQLIDIRKHKRMEFSYQLYRDFFNYLNDPINSDLKDWLFGKEVENIDQIKIGDLLEQLEALWSLQKKKLIDRETVYDLFAFYILKAADTKNPSALQYIDQVRKDESNSGLFEADIFEGYMSLLNQVKLISNIKREKYLNSGSRG